MSDHTNPKNDKSSHGSSSCRLWFQLATRFLPSEPGKGPCRSLVLPAIERAILTSITTGLMGHCRSEFGWMFALR